MDIFTQGALGAAFSQASGVKKWHVRIAGGLGFFAGMAADLDVLIRSSTDPLSFLEYHRHFTHALAFIPIGGLLCAIILHTLGRRWKLTFRQTFLYCTLGYATHGMLDAATSYGTMLFWPFSDERISWSIVSIIDPLLTAPLAVLVIVSGLRRSPVYARIAVGWVLVYLAAGTLQHRAAIMMASEVASARGHAPIRIEAKPSFANILVWKTIYELPDTFHIDAVRAGIAPKIFEGTTVPKLDLARDLPWLDPASQQAVDIERFRFFSNGFIAQDPLRQNRIIDIRYSFIPNAVNALWSINLTPGAQPSDHARYETHREQARENLTELWKMMSSR